MYGGESAVLGKKRKKEKERTAHTAHGLNTPPVPLLPPSPGVNTSFILSSSLLFVLFLGGRKGGDGAGHTFSSDRLGKKQPLHPDTHRTSSLMDHAYCTHTLNNICLQRIPSPSRLVSFFLFSSSFSSHTLCRSSSLHMHRISSTHSYHLIERKKEIGRASCRERVL